MNAPNTYAEIIGAYYEATVKKALEHSETNWAFSLTFCIFVPFLFVLDIAIINAYNIYLSLIFFAFLLVLIIVFFYIILHLIETVAPIELSKKFAIDKHFIKMNKLDWSGARYLIFAESIRNQNLKLEDNELDEIIAHIGSERELKENNIFIQLLSMFLKVFRIDDIVIVLFVLLAALGLDIKIIKTENSELKELELFLRWYKLGVGRYPKIYTPDQTKVSDNNISNKSCSMIERLCLFCKGIPNKICSCFCGKKPS
jgi:hypothetical protein